MHFPFRLLFILSGTFPLVLAQLETIAVEASGVTPSTSVPSTSSVLSSLSSSSSSSSSSSTSALSTQIQPTTTLSDKTSTENPLVLTTIFTQPSGCSGGMTEVASWSTELWQNIVNPVPTLTFSSCYPSQFYYSAVATTVLPPYTQLVCPQDWETYNVTDTYIICCPQGYGLYAPNYHSTSRPGLGAVCTSSIWPDVLMDITSYDSTALATTIYTSAGENGALVFATAFDGTAATSVDTSIPTRLTNSVTSTTAATITSSAGTSISVSGAALALPAVLIVLLL